ncbi:MAG: TadE family protein [Gaiellaceae bacterium]
MAGPCLQGGPASARSGERGQAAVEFALVLPAFALLVLAIVQLGAAFNDSLTLTDAVRAGARQAAVARQQADPIGRAVSRVREAASDLDQGKLAVNVSSDWLRGSPVEVTATYPYEIDLLGVVVASGRLSSKTTERVE